MDRPTQSGPKGGTDTTAILYLAGAALIWGGHAVAGQLAVGQIQPLLLVFLRWAVVGSLLWVLHGKQVKEHWHAIRPRLLITGLAATIGYTTFNSLFYFASERTTAVNVGILQGTIPIFVLAGAAVFQKTRVCAIQIIGAGLAFAGLLLVASRGQPMSLLTVGLNTGDALMLVACGCYAIYTLSLKNRPSVPGSVFFTVMALFAAASAVPFAVVEMATVGTAMPSLKGWLVLLFVAIFPSYLGQLFYLWGVDRVGPGRAGMYVNLVPVFAALLAVLILGEPFYWYHLAALVLVVFGIGLVQRQ
ncbi:MAG: DMT family transporter [Burkholderiaceae bacterium]